MRKVWTYKRKGRPGIYVLWYGDDGRQKSIRCPDSRAAKLYAERLEHRLNQDLYCEPLSVPWEQLVQEYLDEKRDVQRRSDGSIESMEGILRLFGEKCGQPHSLRIGDSLLRQYVKLRNADGLSPATVNRDLRTLHAFIVWGIETGRMGPAAQKIRWHTLRQREESQPVKALTVQELVRLLRTAEDLYGAHWRIRLLLGIGTGLRLRDVERLQVQDIAWEQGGITTKSKKTRKGMPVRPLHPTIMAELKVYVGDRTTGLILLDLFHHSKWDRVRTAAGMPHVTHKMLRKTFGSFIGQAGFGTAVVQDLLEHSDPRLTKNVYTDVSPVRQAAVNAIPIDAIVAGVDRRSEPSASEPDPSPDSAAADPP